MSDNSAIEWTDATWNPVRGCTKVSPGCANCYAETFAERFRGVPGHPYEQGFDLRLVPEKLTEPLRWKKPKLVFVNSMSDLFQDGVPDAFIDGVFWVMQQTERHIYQILTKRPDRMREYVCRMASLSGKERGARVLTSQGWATRACEVAGDGFPWPLPNVWLGVSVENQHFADERIPLLLQTPAAIRFISAEPLLGPVDVGDYLDPLCECETRETMHSGDEHDESCPAGGGKLDWVIVGGESGHGARPFELAWARSIVTQCQAAGVPVFLKQLGAAVRLPSAGKTIQTQRGKNNDPAFWPEDLRVREFPEALS